jgi:hypothetical protein
VNGDGKRDTHRQKKLFTAPGPSRSQIFCSAAGFSHARNPLSSAVYPSQGASTEGFLLILAETEHHAVDAWVVGQRTSTVIPNSGFWPVWGIEIAACPGAAALNRKSCFGPAGFGGLTYDTLSRTIERDDTSGR